MRRYLKAAVATLGLLAATHTSAAELADMTWDQIMAQAKQEGEVTFFSWWGEEWWRTAAQQFEADTGIKVNVVIGDTEATVNKMLTEKDREAGTVDILHFGGQVTKTIIDAHLLVPGIQSIVPNEAHLDPKLSAEQEGVDVKGYVIPVYRNQTGLLYDPARVANPPQTWDDLVKFINDNPGQFAFTDPTKGGSGQALVQAAVYGVLGDSTRYAGDAELDPAKVADWGKVWDWFNSIEDKVVITNSNEDSMERLNQGEVSLAMAWDDSTSIAIGEGTLSATTKLYIPEMGLAGGGDTMGVAANAPHKAAALAFINYLTDAEVQKQMNAMVGSYVARTDVDVEKSLIPEAMRQAHGQAWAPAPYKQKYSQDFVTQVLQH